MIKGKEWKEIPFLNEDAKSSAVLIVAKTEPEHFKGFYIRRRDHPYEPNFETKTYNLLEFCQQDKVQRHVEKGRAGNLIVWTRDERTKKPYFIGTYNGIRKLRKIEGKKHETGSWELRTAVMATETYIVPRGKGVPMKDFENEFRRLNLDFPSEEKTRPFDSSYGRYYVVPKDLTNRIMGAVEENAIKSGAYLEVAESYLRDNPQGPCRFVTREEIEYAKRRGIL